MLYRTVLSNHKQLSLQHLDFILKPNSSVIYDFFPDLKQMFTFLTACAPQIKHHAKFIYVATPIYGIHVMQGSVPLYWFHFH